MAKKFFFVLIILLCTDFLLSQNKFVDSLAALISSEKSDTVKASYYEKIARHWLGKGNADEGLKAAQKVKQLGKQSYRVMKALSYSYHVGASFYSRTGDYAMAEKFSDTTLALRKSIGDQKGIVNSTNYKGILEWYKGNYQRALTYYIKALQLCDELKDSALYLNTYTNMGIVYFNLEKYDQAVKYYNLALSSLDTIKQTELRASTLDNMGLAYYKMKDYKRALPYHLKSLELRLRNADHNISNSYLNVGNAYVALNENTKAKNYYTKALDEKKRIDDKLGMVHVYISLADLAGIDKNFNQAKSFLLQGLSIAQQINSPEMLKEIYKNLADYSQRTGDYKNAYDFQAKFMALKDTIFNAENNETMLEMESKYQNEKKENENKLLKQQNDIQKLESEKKDSDLKKQKNIIILISGGLLIILLLSIVIYKSLRNTRKANLIIAQQKKEVEHQKDLVDEKQKEILDSIHYAKRIQNALLASEDLLKRNLSGNTGHFVYFNPKDIVSGDFYWAAEQDNYFFLAVCDSTGHGVPGAFMSLLNIGFMSEAIKEQNILSPDEVFNYTRSRLISTISGEGQKDGFDGILLRIDKRSGEKCYAAAHNRPLVVSNGNLTELPCDKMPVGYGERAEKFSLFRIENHVSGWLYLYTDGFADQFGGEKGKKFKYKPLNSLILENVSLEADSQKQKLSNAFESWKGKLEQVDDVLIIGIKI